MAISMQLVTLICFLTVLLKVASAAPQNVSSSSDDMMNIEEPDMYSFMEGHYNDEDEGESELALVPTDDQEISQLGDNAIFADYCIRSRDFVMKSMKEQSNNAAARAFMLLFKSAEDVTMEIVSTQRIATETLGNQLAEPKKPYVEAEEPQTDAEKIISDERRKIQEQDMAPKSLIGAFIATLKATGSAIANILGMTVQKQLKNINWMAALTAMEGACDQIADLESQLKDRFEETLTEISSQDPTYESRKFGEVSCVTTKRISQLEGVCSFVKIAHGPFMALLMSQMATKAPVVANEPVVQVA